MSRRKTLCDPKCVELAGMFLGDVPGIAKLPTNEFNHYRTELAQRIQEAIEDWLEYDLREERAANGQFGVGA